MEQNSVEKTANVAQQTKNSKSLILIIAILTIILVLCLSYIAYSLGQERGKQLNVNSPSLSPTIAQKMLPTTTPLTPTKIIDESTIVSDKNNTNLKIFTSPKLGIAFNYLEKQPAMSSKIVITEAGNMIYVSRDGKPESGQSVEVFIKDANDSLETAIKKQFLSNISDKDCFVVNTTSNYKNAQYPVSFIIAEISFPKNENSNEPWFANSNKCPQNYSQTNGIQYFLMDKNHPDKYVFFSIGQYGINAENNKMWQDTLSFLD